MKTMKKISAFSLMACAVLAFAPEASAQTVSETRTTTTTTHSAGTVSEFSSGALVIRDEGGTTIRYRAPEKVVIVDETGAALGADAIHAGEPVTVYYSGEGDSRVVNRVVVKRKPGRIEKHEETTTTTTTP